MSFYDSLSLKGPGHKTRLVALQPGRKGDPVSFSLEIHHFHDINGKMELAKPYDVLEYSWQSRASVWTAINGWRVRIDKEIMDAFRELRSESAPRYLWVNVICVDSKNIPEGRYQESQRKLIYKNARTVFIWIGQDNEDFDSLNWYLGPGTTKSTEVAFQLARSIAQAQMNEAKGLLSVTSEEFSKPSWCYLARLLYRRWYREVPILRTNFTSELKGLDVLCGTASVPWSILETAAERSRALALVPYIFQGDERPFEGDLGLDLQKESAEDESDICEVPSRRNEGATERWVEDGGESLKGSFSEFSGHLESSERKSQHRGSSGEGPIRDDDDGSESDDEPFGESTHGGDSKNHAVEGADNLSERGDDDHHSRQSFSERDGLSERLVGDDLFYGSLSSSKSPSRDTKESTSSKLSRWLRDRTRFGFGQETTLAQLVAKWTAADGKKKAWLSEILDIANDVYGLSIKVTEKNDLGISKLKISESDQDSSRSDYEWNLWRLLPTLDFDPIRSWRKVPPIPSSQLPFIHTRLKTGELRLIYLLPHVFEAAEPLQIALVHHQKEKLPDFVLIQNSHFGNPGCTSTILVNGQAFEITKALEWLLRTYFYTSGRWVFAWPICGDPQFAQLESAQGNSQISSMKAHENQKEYMRFLKEHVARQDGTVAHAVDLCEAMNTMTEREISKELEECTSNHMRCFNFNKNNVGTNQRVVTNDLALGKAFWEKNKFQKSGVGPYFSMSLMEHYDMSNAIHRPLDRFADEIRLLYLTGHGGDPSSPIKCTLLHVPLGHTEQYEAISYTWGSKENMVSIEINSRPFSVTQNLHSLLLRLRHETRTSVLWIDAICINQKDTQERNRQITRMPRIYESAYVVIIWLGEADEDSDLAMDFMNSLNSKLIRPGDQPWSPQLGEVSANYANLDESEKRAWVAVYKLFRKPYFWRTWCVQEQIMAVDMGIKCGNKLVRWEWARLFCYNLALDWNYFRQLHDEFQNEVTNFFPHSPDTLFTRLETVNHVRRAQNEGKDISLLSLLIMNQEAQATVPHDKIFGFWGLAKDASILLGEPDYDKPVQDLFASLVEEWCFYYHSLDIICASQWRVSGTGGVNGLPMWVPDWTATWTANTFISLHPSSMSDFSPGDPEHSPLYSASGRTKPIIAFGKRRSELDFSEGADTAHGETQSLVAAGICLDKIKEIGPECWFVPARPMEEWIEMLETFAGGPLPEMKDKERSESLANDFWTTMIAARSPLGEYIDGNGSKIATTLAFERLTDDRDALRINSLRGSSMWLQRVSNVTRGRCFVITEKGNFGLVHRYANVGDEVCLLMGCSVPVILRKFRGEERFFLGDAYIHGWMEGEMIKELGGEEEIEKTVTMKKFRKWLDNRESMPEGDGEWKPFILV